MEKNRNAVDPTISRAVYIRGWYYGDVVDVLSMRHGLMQKTIIPLSPQIETGKPEIWQFISNITIWYIWKTRFLKVFQNVTERPTQIIT